MTDMNHLVMTELQQYSQMLLLDFSLADLELRFHTIIRFSCQAWPPVRC